MDFGEIEIFGKGICPPESGGQHDRNEVEIMRGVVPPVSEEKAIVEQHHSVCAH
jgi:hypothetical protein